MNIDHIVTKRDLLDFESRLIKVLNAKPNPGNTKRYLRSKEVCEMLNISPATLQNLRNNGQLTYKKLGGTLFYERDEIESRLEQSSSGIK